MKRLLGIGAVIACVLFAGGANAALVKVGNLVLTADGGFTPRTLPRQSFAPIDFTGRADLRSADGSIPPALQQIVLDFDRDGRLSTGGLPICQPALLEEATPAEARARCPGAIVGSGHVSALIVREAGPPILASSSITLFNGPRQAGHPTVILHARTTVPATQTFVLTIPIEKRPGSTATGPRSTYRRSPPAAAPSSTSTSRSASATATAAPSAATPRHAAATASSAPAAASPSPTKR